MVKLFYLASQRIVEKIFKSNDSITGIRHQKLVLDLRNNGGGYLNAALEISSSLIPEKSVVFKEQDKSGKFTKQMTKDEFNQVKMDKIVVLQNENTASASEVLIGALKDNLGKKVTTVGTTSYGKGTEQVTVPFQMVQVLNIQWPSGIHQMVQASTRRALNQILK